MYLDWRNSPGNCLEILRKTKKNVRNDCLFSSPSVNADLPNTSRRDGFNNRTQYSQSLYQLKLEYNYINVLKPSGYVVNQQV